MYKVLTQQELAARKKHQMREKVWQDLKKQDSATLALIILSKLSDADIEYAHSKIVGV
jgi:hypothetical protein